MPPSSARSRRPIYLYLLICAAIWNSCFATAAIVDLQWHRTMFYQVLNAQTEIVANRYFWFAVLLAGLGYGVVAFEQSRFRFFISLGVAGKMLFFIWIAHLWFTGVATDFALGVAFGDLLWALSFIVFMYRTRAFGFF